jgi:hypothetical protein
MMKKSENLLMQEILKTRSKYSLYQDSIWRHNKTGDRYKVQILTIDCNNEIMVNYCKCYCTQNKEYGLVQFTRPLSEWIECVAVGSEIKPRFERVIKQETWVTA